jgi:hypothetical protein
VHALEFAQKFVVVAGDIDDARALARFAQYFLNNVIVLLRPVPGASKPPAVDNVANQINLGADIDSEKRLFLSDGYGTSAQSVARKYTN